MRAIYGLVALAALPVLAACGSTSAFPEPAPCPAPAAASPTANARQAANRYFASVTSAVNGLASQREALRSQYPGEKFSRQSQFRVDFAAYSDSTVCGAQNLKELRAPAPTLESFDLNLDTALQELIDHTEAGRTAVKARNVSDYRTWYQGVDLKIEAVKAAAAGPR